MSETFGMQGLDLIGKALLDDVDIDPRPVLAGTQFAYTVPNFSNPTGRLVGLPMRRALVEDDPYGSLHYDGAPLPLLIELSAHKDSGHPYSGPVVYMGNLSKEIAPGLRIGWTIAALEMIEALTRATQGSDMCTSGVTQRIALAALERSLIESIHPTIIATYRERRDALCDPMSTHLAKWKRLANAIERYQQDAAFTSNSVRAGAPGKFGSATTNSDPAAGRR